jgi:hypothetical protein
VTPVAFAYLSFSVPASGREGPTVSVHALPAAKPIARVRCYVHRLRPRANDHCRFSGLLDESPALRSALRAPLLSGLAWRNGRRRQVPNRYLSERGGRVESFWKRVLAVYCLINQYVSGLIVQKRTIAFFNWWIIQQQYCGFRRCAMKAGKNYSACAPCWVTR